MRILSAPDCVFPAFARTKLVLFSPFRFGRTWKLAATGYLAVASVVFLPWMLVCLAFLPIVRQRAGMGFVWGILAVVLALSVIYLVLFYLCSRLRFAFFDIVLNRGEFVAPAWRKYGPASLKWTAFKVVLGLAVTMAFAAPVAAFVRQIVGIFSSMNLQSGRQPPPELLTAIFSFYAAFFLVYLGMAVFYFLSSLLSDFIVPSLALENTTLSVAFQRLGLLLRRETSQFALYVIVKIGLGLAGQMAVGIAFYIVLLFALVIVGCIALFVGFLLHLAHVSMGVLVPLGVVFGVACSLFFFIYELFLATGTMMTFLESYTLYFLGGRYPMLGDLLERSTPPAQPNAGFVAVGPAYGAFPSATEAAGLDGSR